jgi:methionyl-tRNA formyltransferase
MRLVFAGTPAPAVPSLRALLDSPRHDVVAVVTRPDAPAGRGRRLVRSPVGALLPERTLAVPKHGWINLHFSLLPAWRGAAPVQAAVRAGDEITGATTFRIVRELDAGPVFGTVTEKIRPTDTAGELLERLSVSGADLLVSTLDGIEDGEVRAVEQPTDGVTYAPKVTVADARITLTHPAAAIDRHVRSVTPDPGAWAEFRGQRLKVGPVEIVAEHTDLAPGELRVERRRVLVGTATSALVLGEVQAQGKKRMAATDWARGSRIEQGERLT